MTFTKKLSAAGLFMVMGLALGGCSNTAAVKFAEDAANEICACKDIKCAQESLQKFQKRYTEEFSNAKGTQGDLDKISAAGKKMTDCATKLAAGGQ